MGDKFESEKIVTPNLTKGVRDHPKIAQTTPLTPAWLSFFPKMVFLMLNLPWEGKGRAKLIFKVRGVNLLNHKFRMVWWKTFLMTKPQ